MRKILVFLILSLSPLFAKLIALHEVSQKRLNYLPEHYMEIARVSHAFGTQDIGKIAKENLRIIGQMYD